MAAYAGKGGNGGNVTSDPLFGEMADPGRSYALTSQNPHPYPNRQPGTPTAKLKLLCIRGTWPWHGRAASDCREDWTAPHNLRGLLKLRL